MAWWVKARVHSSWIVALVCTCFVSGVAAALVLSVPWWWGILAVVPSALGFIFRHVWMLPLIALSAGVIGLGYGSAHIGLRSEYVAYKGSIVTVQGKIREDPSKTTSGSTSLQLDSVAINGNSMTGSIYVSVRKGGDVKRGDIVVVKGEAKGGFGNFPVSISAPSVSSAVRPVPGDVGRVVRDWFASEVRENIPEPQASLGIGFLTGQKSALPEDLSEALKIAGLTHIVVASGYNLTILVRMARRLFVRVSKYLAAVSSSVMIIAFMAVTGLSPSMTRAGLVSGLSLMAWYYGHKLHPFVLLPFAAAITVFMNPSYVWGDLGWQLSFTAFAGVMIVAPLLQRYFFGEKEAGVLRQILGETVAAHIVTVPIIAISFGTVSNVAIIANLLVVPLVPLAMLLTFICGIWSIAAIPFSEIVAVPTTWLLGYMVDVATFVSELNWAQSEIVAPWWAWLGYLVGLIALCLWMWNVTRLNFRGTNPIM